MSWTTADLLTAIKNSQMFPDASTGSLSSAALLQFATEELHSTIAPMILSVREKYYETYLDTAYTTSTPTLMIPSRALGGVVSVVQYIFGVDVNQLEPIDPGTIATLQPTIRPSNFYFQNNSVVLYPPPSGSQGTVRMRYFQRPNRLEQTSNCTQITAFNANTGVATCSPPTAWTTSNTFDFVPQTASQATPYNLGTSISAITTSSITFTLGSAPAALVSVGDWIALAEYTPIPEIPFELQPILIQATCCRGLAALNDQTSLQFAKAILQEKITKATQLLEPRAQGGNKRVVSNWRRF